MADGVREGRVGLEGEAVEADEEEEEAEVVVVVQQQQKLVLARDLKCSRRISSRRNTKLQWLCAEENIGR